MGCGSSSPPPAPQQAKPAPSPAAAPDPTPPPAPEPIEPEEEVIDVNNMTPEQLASLSDEEIAQIEIGKIRFLRRLKTKDTTREYIIIVDKSASMKLSCPDKIPPASPVSADGGEAVPRRKSVMAVKTTRWKEAEEVVSFLAPKACECDPDGITLYFFSEVNAMVKEPFKKYSNVKTGDEVMAKFAENPPASGTDLTSVLKDALAEVLNGASPAPPAEAAEGADTPPADAAQVQVKLKPTTILIITDGKPANKKSAAQTIIDATHKLDKNEDLSISFIQVGDDKGADEWLQHMDDQLKSKGAKFDVVDTISAHTIKQMDFAELVKRSIED